MVKKRRADVIPHLWKNKRNKYKYKVKKIIYILCNTIIIIIYLYLCSVSVVCYRSISMVFFQRKKIFFDFFFGGLAPSD